MHGRTKKAGMVEHPGPVMSEAAAHDFSARLGEGNLRIGPNGGEWASPIQISFVYHFSRPARENASGAFSARQPGTFPLRAPPCNPCPQRLRLGEIRDLSHRPRHTHPARSFSSNRAPCEY